MKKTTVRIITASAASLLLVSALCIGSYAALKESGTVASDQYIGYEKAKELALTHAGVSSQSVWFEDIDTDREKGILVYELEFYADGVEYEYKVDAATGEVLKSKADRDDNRGNSPSTNDAPVADGSYISLDEAKTIALSHAGVSADIAKFDDREFDFDDGKAIYELEFYADGVEYEYDVDAKTGEILRSKKENERPKIDDAPVVNNPPKTDDAPVVNDTDTKAPAASPVVDTTVNPPKAETTAPAVSETPTVPETPATSAYIGIDKAKEIALAHAGVSASAARFEDAEFDRDDGRAVYELEFRSGAYEYEYEIDAKTGKVLECDKEYDD